MAREPGIPVCGDVSWLIPKGAKPGKAATDQGEGTFVGWLREGRTAHNPTPALRPVGNSLAFQALSHEQAVAYQMPPSATVIASPFTPPAASLHRNAITSA